MRRGWRRPGARWAAVLALAWSSGSWAQTPPAGEAPDELPSPPLIGPPAPKHERRELTLEQAAAEAARLRRESSRAFEERRHADAERLLRELVPIEHDNQAHWYNLACAIALQIKPDSADQASASRADEAGRMLEQAVARGFGNRVQLETDPDLASIRGTKRYAGVLERWDRTIAQQSRARVERLVKRYKAGEAGSKYTLETDEARGLAIVSGFEPRLTPLVHGEIDRLTRWWQSEVLGASGNAGAGARTPPTIAAGAQPLEGAGAIIAVLLPTRADYLEWAEAQFGERAQRVGGAYMHEERLLVAMDLGATLRHEYWHVLHWRDMEARRQRHPIWVQEGLCSLVEDVEDGPDGSMVVKASWRTNMVRKMAERGLLTKWDALLGMSQERFVRTRPLAMYGQGRAIFMWLHERGKLGAWYRALVDGFASDATGKQAFESVFEQPIDKVEKEFRAWARGLPEVEEQVGRGRANLPVGVEPGAGDGVVVAGVDFAALMRGGRRQPTSELRSGDVIGAINGKPVRDFNDLARVLGEFEAGDAVTLKVRRGTREMSVRATLVPPQE